MNDYDLAPLLIQSTTDISRFQFGIKFQLQVFHNFLPVRFLSLVDCLVRISDIVGTHFHVL